MALPCASRLGVIFFTVFLDLLGFGLVLPLLPQFARQHGASEAVIGLLGATYSAIQFVCAPLWGRLSDRIGRRPVLLASIAGSAISYLAFALAPTLAMLFVARALAGAMAANIGTAQAYIADITPPERRARGMGLIGAAFGLGFVFGPALALVVQGQRAVGLTAAALSCLDLLLAARWLPESLPPERRGKATSPREGRLLRMARALRSPKVGVGVRCLFVATLAWSGLEVTASLLVKERAAALLATDPALVLEVQRRTGLLFAIMGLTAALVQGGLAGRLARRYPEARLATAGLLAAAIAMASLPWVGSPVALAAAAIGLALGQGLYYPALSALISRAVPAHEQGGSLGLAQGFASLARAIGPALAGGLFAWARPLPFLAGALLLATAGIWLLRSGTPTSPSAG